MIVTLFSFLLILLTQISVAETPVTAIQDGNTYTFQAEKSLRYFADNDRGILFLPEVSLLTPLDTKNGLANINDTELGLSLELSQAFRVSLSGDQKTLTLVLGEVLGFRPERISEDERSPVVFYLSNAEPGTVASLLSSLYEGLKVEIDDRQRALLVLVNDNDREFVTELVEVLDRPRPQVMFEAEILEINQDITESLGIEYQSIFKFNFNEKEVTIFENIGEFARNPLGLNVTLNALKTTGAADVLARPRVTTLDGEEAQINATQTVPVIIGSQSDSPSVQNITTGITLRMLPRVAPNGDVEADLSITVSTPTGTTSQGVPQFSTRDANTKVRVANGEPIAIGGLFEKRLIQGGQKVPLLGDIPIIGELFSSTRTEQRETDLVIIVTPRIIDMIDLQTLEQPTNE